MSMCMCGCGCEVSVKQGVRSLTQLQVVHVIFHLTPTFATLPIRVARRAHGAVDHPSLPRRCWLCWIHHARGQRGYAVALCSACGPAQLMHGHIRTTVSFSARFALLVPHGHVRTDTLARTIDVQTKRSVGVCAFR